MRRIIIFAYGVLAYAAFGAMLPYLIGFITGLVVPKSLDSEPTMSFWPALTINITLLLVFALQHSVMARPAFKKRWTRVIPEPAERSTYVLCSVVALCLLMWLWQPLGLVVWDVQNQTARIAIWAFALVGWMLMIGTTFIINHFDLFGLRQVWLHLRHKPYTPLSFKTPGPYSVVRHPLYVGWAIAFWAAPTMTASHLFFATGATVYMLVAIIFEERDLVNAHPEYDAYRKRVSMLLPLPRRKAA